MSRAGPRFIFEMVVMSLVVSAPGCPQMQVSVPFEPTPEGPKAASLSGVSPSSASTGSDRIARQSVGSAMAFVVAVGLGLGAGLPLASGDGVSEEDSDAEGPLLVPPPSPDTGPHAVNAAASARIPAAVTSRAFMATPYCAPCIERERIAERDRRCARAILSAGEQ
jgi:hypothetical protein